MDPDSNSKKSRLSTRVGASRQFGAVVRDGGQVGSKEHIISGGQVEASIEG